ncbi:hypothetical protein [Agromyces sp. LHK192]|uniref:hypothetical protein n=1 Tax=Agromyces sp. LHK192 TaxID=2498704 RepID=UPI000FD8582A|nr:hypothetical protein [Agromyces sp. LHK192]
MNRLTRSFAFWWVLLGIGAAIGLVSAISVLVGIAGEALWLTVFAMACLVLASIGGLLSLRRSNRKDGPAS